MLQLEHPAHLYALALLPLLGLFFWAAWTARRRAIGRFGNHSLMQQLMPQVSRYRQYLKFGLLMLAVALLVVGWANPQYGAKLQKYKRKSVDVILAFDLSQSMLATDITPSRLERARRFGQELVEGLRSERLGMVVFAGSAFLQSPITTDYNAIQLSLRSASPDMIGNQGTAIAEAIELAEESFEDNNKSHKALIIITDGENHEEEALAAAQAAVDKGLIIYTVGVGTAEGGFITIRQNGREVYKRDKQGSPVRSRLNEKVLEDLADAGNGNYFNLAAGSDAVVDALKDRIDKMEKRAFEQRSFSEFESSFQWFVGVALLLLIVEFLLPYRSSGKRRNESLFGENV
jgi:Ca-activated chloride channel family protein